MSIPFSFPAAYHDEVFMKAVAAGCFPKWLNGILGFTWHCVCADYRHALDSQCTAVKFYKKEHR